SPEPKVISEHRETLGMPSGYAITYVKSDRKWKLSFNSQPFNQISEDFEQRLADALDQKGVHRTPVIEAGCCRITIELLEVTTHPAVMKKPGIDVSATVTVTDATGRFVYGKGYRGESRTGFVRTYKHLITQAVGDMVANVVADENVTRILVTGKF